MAKEPINKKLDPEVTRIILELDLLKSQADSFRNALDSVQHRIADLEKTNSECSAVALIFAECRPCRLRTKDVS
jgi:hypothetical protein